MSTETTTVLVTTRHGHGTWPICVDNVLENTNEPIAVKVVDMMSPPSVSEYLDRLVADDPRVTRVRFDTPVSRQTGRLAALEQIDTDLTVLIDNNMVLEPGCLDRMIEVSAESDVDVVSPMIVTKGGRVHFSGGRVVNDRKHRLARSHVRRPPAQDDAPVRSLLAEVSPMRVEIDYCESHAVLFRTADLRKPSIIDEKLYNAHTCCVAGYRLKHGHGRSMILDPEAVTSIVPIAFGYDLPWILKSYMRRDWLESAYRTLARTIGKGPGSSIDRNISWHVKHLKYLLLTMADEDRVRRTDFLRSDEIPDYIEGYDFDLPDDADERIEREVLPGLAREYPDLMAPLHEWIELPIGA